MYILCSKTSKRSSH